MPSPARRTVSYAVIAAALIAPAEGLWTTARVDRIGTGQPPTVCYGMTSADRPVRVGDRYTPEQCMAFLIHDIPKYAAPILKCIHVPVSNHFAAAMTSAGYNAGARAVCHSPMVARINADPKNVKHACDALRGWYVHAGGRYIPGLANRREKERKVCVTED
jgi:lysozyme